LVLSSGIFASTNVDDLFVLVAFFADRSVPRWRIVGGQILGIAIIVAASLALALAALAISPARVGLLGVVPVFLGFVKLLRLRGSDEANVLKGSGPFAVAGVTIANGGDNIGVYTPIFASQTREELALTVAVFGALTLIWCLIASALVSHPAAGKPIRHYGHIVLPVVLMGLGAVILYRSGAVQIWAN
jgi:cadmium resistance protein CadD (predicted permease)